MTQKIIRESVSIIARNNGAILMINRKPGYGWGWLKPTRYKVTTKLRMLRCLSLQSAFLARGGVLK